MLVTRMLMLVVVVVIVADEVQAHPNSKENLTKKDKSQPDKPDKFTFPPYKSWRRLVKRFLAHTRKPPSKLTLQELKPHLRTLLDDLQFLPKVNKYLDENLSKVSTAGDARVVYSVLDLYGALDKHMQVYLLKVRHKFVSLAELYPEFGRNTGSFSLLLAGFDRHCRAMKESTRSLYRKVMEPRPNNIDLLAHYRLGFFPAFDKALIEYGIHSPFMAMDEGTWYQLKPVELPQLALSVDLLTWELVLVKHTLTSTLFRFKPVVGESGEIQYLVESAVLPSTAPLTYPCEYGATLSMSSVQTGVALKVVGLSGGESAIIHKSRDQALFLQYDSLAHADMSRVDPDSAQVFISNAEVAANDAQMVKVNMASRYPGRKAHWQIHAVCSTDKVL